MTKQERAARDAANQNLAATMRDEFDAAMLQLMKKGSAMPKRMKPKGKGGKKC